MRPDVFLFPRRSLKSAVCPILEHPVPSQNFPASRYRETVRSSLPHYRLQVFSALLNFNSSRSFILALCSCDLLLPIEQPIISAISLCS